MKYIQTTIYVNDIDKSVDFYQNLLGLEIVNRYEINSKQLVFLGTGETKVELIYDGKVHTNPEKMNISIGFECKDLEQSIKKFKDAGYVPIGDVRKINEFVQFIYFKDPNGYKIQILERKS